MNHYEQLKALQIEWNQKQVVNTLTVEYLPSLPSNSFMNFTSGW